MKKMILTLLVLVTLPSMLNAQGGLSITPKRIEFVSGQRAQEVYLMNRSSTMQTYDISFVEYKMNEDGSINKAEEADTGMFLASEFIRFFPRRVTLGPGESQSVRLQVREPRDLPDNEYRSHLVFRSVPSQKPTAFGEDDHQEEGLTLRLDAIYGISIPVIFRKGDLNADVRIENIEIDDSDPDFPTLNLQLQRSGNMSAYGDLSIIHVSQEGVLRQIGLARGIAVYTPLNSRQYSLRLSNLNDLDLSRGTIKVRYDYNKNHHTREVKTTEETFSLN